MIQVLILVLLLVFWSLSSCDRRREGVYGNSFFDRLDTVVPLKWCSQSSSGGDYSAWANLRRVPRVRDSLIETWKLVPQHGEDRYQFERFSRTPPDTTVHWYTRPTVPEGCSVMVKSLYREGCPVKEWAPHLQMWRGKITKCDWTFLVDDGKGLYLYGDVSQGCIQ